MQKFSDVDARLKLLQLTIILIPFSYQPRLFLSDLQGLTMEISFVQISAILFILFSIRGVLVNISRIQKLWTVRLLAIFVLYNWLTIFWSADAARTFVLAGYWTFLLAVVVSVVALFYDRKIARKDITNPLMIGAIVGVLFGTWQYLGSMNGVNSSFTLLRHAYNPELFGFPRIQAFALEPQFYANALLAPILYLGWRMLFTKWQKYHAVLLAWFFAVFLLTVSRGATLGFMAGSSILLLLFAFKEDHKNRLPTLFRYLAVLAVGLIGALGLIFASGEIQSEKYSGAKSVETFVDHMSHGVIDIRIAKGEGGREVDGLVKASTSGRFYMVGKALDISSSEPHRYLIGVGTGSFGPVFAATYKNADRINHVVNNQYIEFFTELGIIGLLAFMSFVAVLARSLWKKTGGYKYVFLAILVAYLVQFSFFSLQTNVAQTWLFVGIVIGVSAVHEEKKKRKKS